MPKEAQHVVTFENPREERTLLGTNDGNLKRVREAFGIRVSARGGVVRMSGDPTCVQQAVVALDDMLKHFRRSKRLLSDDVDHYIRAARNTPGPDVATRHQGGSGWLVSPKTQGQEQYLHAMEKHEVVFCIGPAGTGKTYLAVSMALNLLQAGDVRKIVLARPAVEAGEKLGFLPGDLQEKVNPFLRPLYDALNDLLDFGQVKRYMARDIIEVAPLAYMRGRTLNHSFVILDEAQNTTGMQMKMFLTRLGQESRAVITGDITQADLPPGQRSGLIEAAEILRNVKGLSFVHLTKTDVVRHRIVQAIVHAYEEYERIRQGEGRPDGATERTEAGGEAQGGEGAEERSSEAEAPPAASQSQAASGPPAP